MHGICRYSNIKKNGIYFIVFYKGKDYLEKDVKDGILFILFGNIL